MCSTGAARDELEARQQAWLTQTAKAAQSAKSPEMAGCTSCHAGLPYLLAR
jgi:hypothetical protein